MFQISVSAKEDTYNKYVYYFLGCGNNEVISDINLSIHTLKDFTQDNNINIIYIENIKTCGYLLAYGDESEYRQSALTDVDLMLLLANFFRLKTQ